MARKLGQLCLLLDAAPEHLERFGRPDIPDQLKRYVFICGTNMRGVGAWPLLESGQVHRLRSLVLTL